MHDRKYNNHTQHTINTCAGATVIFHKPSNSLILKLKDATRVTDVIPKSRTFEYKGDTLTQVHCGLDEVKVLNNLGFDAPSPIHHRYQWAGKYTPMVHQANTSAFLTLNPRAICLNDMGTGKTLSILWAADYLMAQGKMKKLLIIGPLSTMHAVWESETNTHFLFRRKCVVLHGTKQRRLDLLNTAEAEVFIINHDGIKTIEKSLIEANFDAVVVDEAAAFRNASTNRYKALSRIVESAYWLWLLTGTPVPTAPTDAWALGKLLKNPSTPKYFTAFKTLVMDQVTNYKWVPKPGAYAKAFDILQPGIRYTKDECLDLPPITFVHHECGLTDAQKRCYKEMQKDLVADIGGSEVTAANAAVKLGKLLQICCGEVYDGEGGTAQVDATPRLKVCAELVENAANKVIVFVPFTSTLDRVAAYLNKKGHKAAIVDGRTSSGARKKIFEEFQRGNQLKVLVAHPQTTAHGLTLTAADTTIWFAPIFSLEIYEQANARMDRPGQKNHMTVALLHGCLLEEQVYQALNDKSRMQDSVLKLYKKELGAA